MEMYHPRLIEQQLVAHLERPEITLIVGPRQTGKTTLMRRMAAKTAASGAKTVLLNLDVETDAPHFTTQEALLRRIRMEAGNARAVVFIDEIQRKRDAGIFLKGLYDLRTPYKFVVTGSGSLELRERVHESLAGRKRLFEVLPFSFEEYVDCRTEGRYRGRVAEFLTAEPAKAESLLHEYASTGGYPRVALAEGLTEKTAEMAEIFRSYIDRDIVALLRIGRTEAFTAMVRMLAVLEGRIINLSEMQATAGISTPTVRNYLYYLEKTFILDAVRPFHTNPATELAKAPTAYFLDPGMRAFAAGRFGAQPGPGGLGFSFQELVYGKLRSILIPGAESVRFWRTKDGAEVDFIVQRGADAIPVEVKGGRLDAPAVPRGLRSFLQRYQPRRAFVVTAGFEGTTTAGGAEIPFLPLWKLSRQALFGE